MKIGKIFRNASLGATVTIALTMPVLAQSTAQQEADDIRSRLENQKTRGLVLVPSGNQPTPTDVAATPDEPAPTVATETYVELDQDVQVNVQISFDFDSAALREDQKSKLVVFCEVLKSMQDDTFNIVGHTDASGTASYNERLSLLRAQEVKRHLVDDCGIDSVRLIATGVGESFPFDKANPNADENRRVEFQAAS